MRETLQCSGITRFQLRWNFPLLRYTKIMPHKLGKNVTCQKMFVKTIVMQLEARIFREKIHCELQL
jgi:hypothetical protein